MPSKIHALAACLLIIGTAAAHNKTHTIHKDAHNTGAYTVKQGDNDWTIAHKLGISVNQLHDLNPTVDWSDLQIGVTLSTTATKSQSSRSIRSKYAEVSADSATIRRSPGLDGEKITLVDKGTKVKVIKSSKGWCYLQFPKGTLGWMRADLLSEVSAPVTAQKTGRVAQKKAKKAVLTVAAVETHPQPVIYSRTSRWERTRLTKHNEADHSQAKVAMLEIAANEDAGPTSTEVLAKAYGMLGTHYVWGGQSSRGVDCSGFTSLVLHRVGIKLPRTSRSQATIGEHVAFAQLKPGDLVFFHTGGSARINHVGLYIGNDKFIHASSGYGAVRIDSLSGHYGHELVTARRIPSLKHEVVEAAYVAADVKTEPQRPPAPAPKEVATKPEEVATKEPPVVAPKPKPVVATGQDEEWQKLSAAKKGADKTNADGAKPKVSSNSDVH